MTKIYIKNRLKLLAAPLIKLCGRGKRFLPEKRFWELIYRNYPPRGNFTFIQVGANDGKSFDILYDIAKERKSKGIVIEPLKDFYDQLCETYKSFPEIIKINIAVHPTKKKVEIFRVDPLKEQSAPDWAKGIASLDPHHHKKSNISSGFIIEEKVSAAPLMEIVKKINLSYKTDLLQIDVEGFDYEVLKMVDFEILKPCIIKYEFTNLTEDEIIKSGQLLETNGYYLFSIGDDMIGVLLDKIRL